MAAVAAAAAAVVAVMSVALARGRWRHPTDMRVRRMGTRMGVGGGGFGCLPR